MEYYTSDGHVLKELARRFNNSTFLALMDGDLEKAKQLYQQTKEAKLANIAITNVKLNERFSHKLLKSPDFLRYQLIGENSVLISLYVITMEIQGPRYWVANGY